MRARAVDRSAGPAGAPHAGAEGGDEAAAAEESAAAAEVGSAVKGVAAEAGAAGDAADDGDAAAGEEGAAAEGAAADSATAAVPCGHSTCEGRIDLASDAPVWHEATADGSVLFLPLSDPAEAARLARAGELFCLFCSL
jgi:hypothetical protein